MASSRSVVPVSPPPPFSEAFAPSPCFFSRLCGAPAAMEKAGRSVCRACAQRLRGVEYPLRCVPTAPLYLTGRLAAEALDMLED